MNTELKNVIREWDEEISREAARLIESGVPPYDAVFRARETVTLRRESAVEEAKTRKEHHQNG